MQSSVRNANTDAGENTLWVGWWLFCSLLPFLSSYIHLYIASFFKPKASVDATIGQHKDLS